MLSLTEPGRLDRNNEQCSSSGGQVIPIYQHRNLAHPTIESDPVGPHSIPELSVSLRFDADHGEHYPDHRVHPGVKMFRAQPVADGPAGPDRKRRPVGPDEVYATHDDVRPTAGSLFRVLWNIEKYHPRTIHISRYLRARWARMR